jgi:hypothetical protein
VDGGDVDDAQWGSPTINVSQDAVQEFKVFRGQFDRAVRPRAVGHRLGGDAIGVATGCRKRLSTSAATMR